MVLSYGRRSREPIRYWYLLALPSVWLVLMVTMWSMMWGGDTTPVLLAGFPGHLLTAMFRSDGVSRMDASTSPNLVLALAGGAAIMVGVGLLQDYLRVPPRWSWTYAAGAVFGAGTWLAGMGQLWADVLFWGCMGLYAVSIVLCLVRAVQSLREWFARRTMCKGS